MKKNVGTIDRVFRVLGALAAVMGAFVAPLPVAVRVPVFGAMAVYFLFSAFTGSCIGYRLMGASTCPAKSQ